MGRESKRQARIRKKAEAERITRLEADIAKLIATKEKTKWYERPLIKIGIPLLAIILAFTYFAYTNRIFYSQKEKNDQDNIIENTLIGPEINPPNEKNISHEKEDWQNKTYFSDTLPRTDSQPPIKGIEIDKYNNQKFVNSGSVTFKIGQVTKTIAASFLFQPINVLPLGGNPCRLEKPLLVGVLKNRLYVSVDFDNLEDGENIGTMEYNHWKLWKSKKLQYDYDERSKDKFEVRDRNGYIVLSIQYIKNPDITQANVVISGYLLDKEQILVMNSRTTSTSNLYTGGTDNCFQKQIDPGFKSKARSEVAKINSIFEHPNLKSTN